MNEHDNPFEHDEWSDAINRAQRNEPSHDKLIDALVGLQPQANEATQQQLEDALIQRMKMAHPNGHAPYAQGENQDHQQKEVLAMREDDMWTKQKRTRSRYPWMMATAAVLTLMVLAGALLILTQRGRDVLPYADPISTPTSPVTRGPRASSTPTDTHAGVVSNALDVAQVMTATPTYTPTSTATLTDTATPTLTLTPTFTITPSDTPMPTATHTPTLTMTPMPSDTPTLSSTPSNEASCQILLHSVQSGETLMLIAEMYDTAPEMIWWANKLYDESTGLLQVGDVLVIPTGSCVLMELRRGVAEVPVRSEPVVGDNVIGYWTPEDDLSRVVIQGRYQDWLLFVNYALNFGSETDVISTGWVSEDYVTITGSEGALAHLPDLNPFEGQTPAQVMNPVQVLVAAQHISPGVEITRDMLTSEGFLGRSFEEIDTFGAADYEAVVGRMAAVPIVEGEIIRTFMLEPDESEAESGDYVTIFTALHDVPQGTVIGLDMVTPQTYPAHLVPEGAYTDTASFIDQFARMPIFAGQVLTSQNVSDNLLDLSDFSEAYVKVPMTFVEEIPAGTIIQQDRIIWVYLPRYGDSAGGWEADQAIIEALLAGQAVYTTQTIPPRTLITHDVASISQP